MERDSSHIHIPGVETSRFRYKEHHPDGRPVISMAVSMEAEFAKLVESPKGGVIYELKEQKI